MQVMSNEPVNLEVSIESMGGLQRRMTVIVPETAVSERVASRLKDLSKTARVDGFRKGKAPFSVLKRQYGDAVYADVVNDTIEKTLSEAFEKESLQPAGHPTLESIEAHEGNPLHYKVSFEVYPEITLTPLEALEIEKRHAEISEADVDKAIDELRESSAQWHIIDRAAQEKDRLKIDFVGMMEGTPFEGGSALGHLLEIGSQSFIPGFESQLIGIKAGDKKTLELSFPAEYHQASLAGKPVQFEVTVHEVAEKRLPELNAEFFQEKHQIENGDLNAFRTKVRERMQRELEQHLKRELKRSLIESIASRHEFELPKALIEREIDSRVKAFKRNFQQYVGGLKNLPEIDRELFREEAGRGVKVGLLFTEIVKQFDLKVSEEDLQNEIKKASQPYENPEQMEAYFMSNVKQREQFEALALEERLVDLVLEKAKIKEKTISYQEAMQVNKEEV
jgi:trigger factor